jgi:hypothetical protein
MHTRRAGYVVTRPLNRTLEVMGTRIWMLIVFAVLTAMTTSAQTYQPARVLSAAFLSRLAQHGLLPSQVAIINVSVGSVIILNGDGAGAVVYIDGAGSFVWAQVAEQLSESVAEAEPMHLKMERRSVEVALCPAMIEHITEFLSRLHAFDPRASGGSPPPTPQEVIVDATAFLIITARRDAVVTIEPNGPFDPPLQQAAGRLHSAVSRCAGSVIPEVQQHDF